MTAATKCRSCHAPIFYARTPSGTSMPIDAGTRIDGNLVIVDGVAHVRPDAYGPKFVAHFATCPEAKKWRKP